MVLIILIMSWLNGRTTTQLSKNNSNDDNLKEKLFVNIVQVCILFLFNLGFIIWCGFELYEKAEGDDCKDLRHSELYKFAFGWFIVYLIVNSIILMCIISVTCVLLMSNNKSVIISHV